MMINVFCKTNLDEYKKDVWPRKLAGMPSMGEYVTSMNGTRLKICIIVHCWDSKTQEPYIQLDLNK